jgi:CheY-like chemotaxis protein
MPDMDGFEVAHRLRATPELAHTTIVAVTGYGRHEDRQMSAAAGFDAHLVKPVEFDALARVLASAGGTSVAAITAVGASSSATVGASTDDGAGAGA